MEDRIKKKQGLPNYFKKIGLLIIAIPICFIVLKLFSIELLIKKEIMKTLILDLFIIGLLFIASASDKIEDERTTLIRLKVSAFTLLLAVFNVILREPINYIFEVLFGEPCGLVSKSGEEIVLQMLICYIIFYELAKRDLLFKGKEN